MDVGEIRSGRAEAKNGTNGMNAALLEESTRTLNARHCALLEAALSPLLPHGGRYALVDFPDHSNVGDSAIWVGERVLLRKLTGRDPDYVSTIRSYDQAAVDALPPEAPLLIHGGGNLGDLWPRHQQFREQLIAGNRARPIVQLPQSIRFGDDKRAAEFKTLLAGADNFTLFVRDRKSQVFARETLGLEAALTPDSAVGMGPQKRSRTADQQALILLRTDHEAEGGRQGALHEIERAMIVDWLDERDDFASRTFKNARRKSLLALRFARQARRLDFYDLLARGRVERGLDLLSRGEVTITDRLHAHILSVLLGLPTVALDNNYGKVSGYIQAWTSDYAGLRQADTQDEAVAALASLSSL